MLDRQRLAVHGDGDDRVAPVHRVGDREPAREAVDGAADDLVGAGLHAGLAQQVVEAGAEPAGVADVAAADLVGHARQRDVALDHLAGEQVLVGQLELVVDHARDPQRVVLGADLWRGEGGVDAVEVGVRRDERRHPGDVDLHAGRESGQRFVGRRQPNGGARLGRREATAEPAAETAESAAPAARPPSSDSGAGEELAAAAARRVAASLTAAGGRPHRPADQPQRADPRQRPDDTRCDDVPRRAGCAGSSRPTTPMAPNSPMPITPTTKRWRNATRPTTPA